MKKFTSPRGVLFFLPEALIFIVRTAAKHTLFTMSRGAMPGVVMTFGLRVRRFIKTKRQALLGTFISGLTVTVNDYLGNAVSAGNAEDYGYDLPDPGLYDEYFEDPLGDQFFVRHGKNRDKRVMFSAHMDGSALSSNISRMRVLPVSSPWAATTTGGR
ncbi:MAG: hypothetical protein LBU18_01465 [Treponema sp.]|jgi:hypothetical protein|nr:hypothetical protein [Treponema sp.]